MRILLLGGSGFFGKSFIDYFQKNVFQNNSDYKLILASRNIDKVKNLVYSKFIDKKIFLENLDVTKCTYLPEVDLIIHAANSTSEKDYINNIENEKQNIINGTENILNIIKKNTNFIYISSGAVYGRQENISKGFSEDESMVSSLEGSKFHYAAAKAEAESIVIKYSKNNSINSVIARCFAFVGKHLPLDSHFYIGNMIKSILNKEDHEIKSPNKVFRSYMHSDDLVRALLFLNTFASSNCEIFNIGSNEICELHELAFMNSNKYAFNITGYKKANNELNADIYIPNIDKLLSKGFKLNYTISHSIENIIKELKNE